MFCSKAIRYKLGLMKFQEGFQPGVVSVNILEIILHCKGCFYFHQNTFVYQVVQHFIKPESKCVCFVHIHPPILKAEIPVITFYWNLAKKLLR